MFVERSVKSVSSVSPSGRRDEPSPGAGAPKAYSGFFARSESCFACIAFCNFNISCGIAA